MTHRHALTAFAFATGLSLFGFAQVASAQPSRRPRAGRVVVPSAARAPVHSALTGRITDRDPTDDEGRHRRVRMLPLRRGDRVTFSLSSEELDTVARVEGPRGQHWEDDDGAGSGTDSRLRFVAPADGVYRFIVTTYEPGETGRFQVTLDVLPAGASGGDDDGWSDPQGGDEDEDGDGGRGGRDDSDDEDDDDSDDEDERGSLEPAPAPSPSSPGGRTFGVFVGITDYGGEGDNLPGSAQDAVELARAFEQAGWMQRSNAVVLTDREATAANIRVAFQRLAPRVGAGDTFVFFYDGHGGTNVLGTRGSDLRREELDRLLGQVRGRSLTVLDSCHAGGFASLVRGQPDRYALLSSRANELSSTAPSVNAGGWLAYFLREGVAGGAPRSSDGSVSFRELSQYVQERYDREGVSQRQHLVVAAGSRGDFALGGPSSGTGQEPTTVVASRTTPTPGTSTGVPTLPWGNLPLPSVQLPNGVPGQLPSGAELGSLINTSVGVASAFLGALTK